MTDNADLVAESRNVVGRLLAENKELRDQLNPAFERNDLDALYQLAYDIYVNSVAMAGYARAFEEAYYSGDEE